MKRRKSGKAGPQDENRIKVEDTPLNDALYPPPSTSILPPTPPTTQYQFEYPDMHKWKPENWSSEQKQDWAYNVEKIASKIDKTPEHHMSYRLAEEIKASGLRREDALRHYTKDYFDATKSLQTELRDVIEETKQSRAEIEKAKCRCQVANIERKKLSWRKRMENIPCNEFLIHEACDFPCVSWSQRCYCYLSREARRSFSEYDARRLPRL